MDNSYIKELLSYWVASNIHEDWKKKRIIENNQNKITYKSSWKTTNDVAFIYNMIRKKVLEFPYNNKVIISTNNVVVDIANLEFAQLPYDLQYEYLKLAKTCMDLIFEKAISYQLISNSEISELVSLIYMRNKIEQNIQDECSILLQDEIEDIEKEEYKSILCFCIDAVKNYLKGSINLEVLKQTFGVFYETDSELNLIDTAKFLKIDTQSLKPLTYLKYSNIQKQELYWNADEYTGILTYLNTNNIKNTWFIKNFYKYINQFNSSNIREIYNNLSKKVLEYENKPKWLVKTEQENVFKKLLRFMRRSFLEKKIVQEIEEYNKNKEYLKFLTQYMTYTENIEEIKKRYKEYQKKGVCTIEFHNNTVNDMDRLYIYSNGSLVYIASNFWEKPQLLLNVKIGTNYTDNMVKFLDSVSCQSISNVAVNCSLRIKNTPTFSKINTVKKLFSLNLTESVKDYM